MRHGYIAARMPESGTLVKNNFLPREHSGASSAMMKRPSHKEQTRPQKEDLEKLFEPIERHDSSFAWHRESTNFAPAPNMSPVSIQFSTLTADSRTSAVRKDEKVGRVQTDVSSRKDVPKLTQTSNFKSPAKRRRIKCSSEQHYEIGGKSTQSKLLHGQRNGMPSPAEGEIVYQGVRLVVPRNVRLSMMVNGLFDDDAGAVKELLRTTSRKRLKTKSTKCGAKQFAERIRRNVEMKKSRIHGKGLFSKWGFRRGEFITEYLGSIIEKEDVDAVEQYHLRMNVKECYLFRLPNGDCIDATKSKCEARYLNHSCQANVTSVPVLVDSEYRIIFYANRDIEAKEELTIDYQFEKETDPRLKVPCYCGAPSCRGFMN